MFTGIFTINPSQKIFIQFTVQIKLVAKTGRKYISPAKAILSPILYQSEQLVKLYLLQATDLQLGSIYVVCNLFIMFVIRKIVHSDYLIIHKN